MSLLEPIVPTVLSVRRLPAAAPALLLAYGAVDFCSKVGQLAGNHFLTITKGKENLYDLGRMCLWKGAQDIVFSLKK